MTSPVSNSPLVALKCDVNITLTHSHRPSGRENISHIVQHIPIGNISHISKVSFSSLAEPPSVEAVVGGTAFLPCNVTLEDDEATLILWYRSDLPNPIYTLDVRNASLRNARRFPSSEMGNRANFDIATQPPTLLLSNVTINDAKDYRCRVDLRRSRTLILHSRLRVIGELTFLFEVINKYSIFLKHIS
ncbi:ig-like domain-containing protein [Trichonephila inaurata madagascariensis]|uniref:Ig-like domain-containing protein n=1 Tax=Trichonephila inaurata madagascariensis TaxID=2747483 RepID=A0A8X6JUA3_9ARAC|nr:ig-like domain-containing protein [Trichonephila inaurata madagascariensis]